MWVCSINCWEGDLTLWPTSLPLLIYALSSCRCGRTSSTPLAIPSHLPRSRPFSFTKRYPSSNSPLSCMSGLSSVRTLASAQKHAVIFPSVPVISSYQPGATVGTRIQIQIIGLPPPFLPPNYSLREKERPAECQGWALGSEVRVEGFWPSECKGTSRERSGEP